MSNASELRGERAFLLLRRLLAFIVDWYCASLVLTVGVSAVASATAGELTVTSDLSTLPLLPATAALLLAFTLFTLYFYLPGKLSPAWAGQSLGKHLLKLRLVRADGKEVGLPTVLLRQVLFMALGEQFYSDYAYAFRNWLTLLVGSGPVRAVYYITLLWGGASLLSALLARDGRAVHDWLAGTRLDSLV